MRVVCLGEIMLRLSAGGGVRLADGRTFAANYGGAEANVAIALAHMGHEVAFASKVPENALGDAAIAHLRRHGVDAGAVLRGGPRLGTYYLEEGVGPRASRVTYDRAGSSFATMRPCEWNVGVLLDGADLLHVSGICPALSPDWRTFTLEVVREAARRGVRVSYDVNYRSALWAWDDSIGTLREVLPFVSWLSAGIGDSRGALGLPAAEWSEQGLFDAYAALLGEYDRLEAIYSTRRVAHSSSSNDLTGLLATRAGKTCSRSYRIEPIVDRVGGGDAFSAGVLHGLLSGFDPHETVEFGTATAVLKHTVAGDCCGFSAREIQEFMGAGADVAR